MTAAVQSALLGRRERLWPVVIVSAAIHAGLIVLAVLERPPAVIDLQQKPIVAKLVRLGEKRPEAWLPRKEPAAAPPAPAPPAPVAKPEPKPPPAAPTVPSLKPKEAPAPKQKPKSASTAPRSSSRDDVLASVLSKVKREKATEPVYGDPEGDPLGDASEGNAGDRYLALVERALRESYVLPMTISERDRLHLRATVLLFIDPDGRIIRHTFESRSGNEAFDAALERAIGDARLPPPPPELRQKYRTEGLGVIYRP